MYATCGTRLGYSAALDDVAKDLGSHFISMELLRPVGWEKGKGTKMKRTHFSSLIFSLRHHFRCLCLSDWL